MNYQKITPFIADQIEKIIDRKDILTDIQDIEIYSHDETPGLKSMPEMVVRVREKGQIIELLKLCSRKKIPITPRGGGTGLTGGAVPVKGGIVLSFEKMNQIKEIDRENHMAVVEPGVINANLQRELAKEGLFYPVNPASMDSCTIGGNVAQSSSGANAVKYGGTREYVTGLEAILPSGEKIKVGGKLVKNATDHRLIQLLVGSEGTLAAISEICLRTIPLPEARIDFVAGFKELSLINKILYRIWTEKIIPTSIEYLDPLALETARGYVENPPPLPKACHCLMISIDGSAQQVERDFELLSNILTEINVQDVLVAEEKAKQETLWKFRQSVRESLLKSGVSMVEEDMVVPRQRIVDFIQESRKIYEAQGLKTGVYGHLGDGNIHLNFVKTKEDGPQWNVKLEDVLEKLFQIAIDMGGKISGEHGIGITKKKYLPMAMSKVEIELMKKLKKSFDPENILNPGKIFDME